MVGYKKIIIWIFFFLVFLCKGLYGQIVLGLYTGVNYSNLNTKLIQEPIGEFEQDHFHYKYSYKVGVSLKIIMNNLNFNTGIGISDRGTKSVGLVQLPSQKDVEVNISYTFCEVPIFFSRSILKSKFEYALGIVNSIRVGSNWVTEGDENEIYSFDLALFVKYYPAKKFSIEYSFLFGGVDKLMLNKTGNYLHLVNSVSISYLFYNKFRSGK